MTYNKLFSTAVRIRKKLDPSGASALRGQCFTATEDLAFALLDLGADDVTILENPTHCFLCCSGYFIDVTCRQFDNRLPAVKMFKFDEFDWTTAPSYWKYHRVEAIYLDGTRKLLHS
ncbi:MAG: hypothetical protein KJ556_21845 [Gammaproteobacteria bacterium]|nr:hypothetical protein [Gammaproteobacteria bacterium]